MESYLIEDAKCGLTDMGSGPGSPNVVASVKFKLRDETKWLSLVEVEGIPNVYLSDKDIYDDLIKEDVDDENFKKYMDSHFIKEFNGIKFDVDYSTTFECFRDEPDNPAIPLIRYLFALIRCSMEDLHNLVDMAKGKYACELDISKTDLEEEWEEFEGEE